MKSTWNNVTTKGISIPRGVKHNDQDLCTQNLKTLLKESGVQTITAEEAYKLQPSRPEGTVAVITGMDGLVMRQWYDPFDEVKWTDTWFRVESSSSVVPVGCIARWTCDGIQVSLSPGEFSYCLCKVSHELRWGVREADCLIELLKLHGVSCEYYARRAFRKADALSATFFEVNVHFQGSSNPFVEWYAAIGVNHLPIILQYARPVEFIEPRAARLSHSKINPNSYCTASVVRVYSDIDDCPGFIGEVEDRNIKPAMDRIYKNGSTNVIPVNAAVGVAAHLEQEHADLQVFIGETAYFVKDLKLI